MAGEGEGKSPESFDHRSSILFSERFFMRRGGAGK